MREYLFYPYRADGVGLTFEAMHLPSDADAQARAVKVLEDHVSADLIVVWQEDRLLLRVARQPRGPPRAARRRRR